MTSSKLSKGVSNNLKNIGQNVLRGTDVFDCEQLYCLLGLLILEGRVPDDSENGRNPGPHAHYAFNNSTFKNHVCDLNARCCLIAQHHRERLSELARRNQPLSIEVWLLPECNHYDNFTNRAETNFNGTSVYESLKLDCPIQDSFLLIEEWVINIIPKRSFTGPVQNVTTLLKTITSYLHSSNLSNLLMHNRGRSPKNIFYKISNFQNSLYANKTDQQANYRQLAFPSIGSGESNILSLALYALLDHCWIDDIRCDICIKFQQQKQQRQKSKIKLCLPEESKVTGFSDNSMEYESTNSPTSNNNNRLKLTTSSSVFSVSSISNREKSLSENQDKRRGFTLPLKSTKIKQEIISPMVVCTDQSDKPPINLLSTNTRQRRHYHQLTTLVKDATPYPKYQNLEDLSQSFVNNLHLASTQDLPTSSSLSSSSATPVSKPRTKSENRIIFTDSSSCESIDKCPNNYVVPINTDDNDNSMGDFAHSYYYSSTKQNDLTDFNESLSISNNNINEKSNGSCNITTTINNNDTGQANINNNLKTAFPSSASSSASASSSNFGIDLSGINKTSSSSHFYNQPNLLSFTGSNGTNKKQSVNPSTSTLSSFSSSSTFSSNIMMKNCTSSFFHKKTGLPLQSSPAPSKKYLADQIPSERSEMGSAIQIKSNKSALAMNRLAVTPGGETSDNKTTAGDMCNNRNLSSSAPVVSSQKLLVNFERKESILKILYQFIRQNQPETLYKKCHSMTSYHINVNMTKSIDNLHLAHLESMLNMRIHPLGVINGFEVDIGASGSFNPRHARLPLITYFFQLSDDNAPSPYLGFVDLQCLVNKRGYQIPKKGSIQLTLFNPNGAVIKMFVVLYNLSDMPPNHQTFLRQRTIYMPIQPMASVNGNQQNQCYWSNWTVGGNTQQHHSNISDISPSSQCSLTNDVDLPSYLRYLVHLKIHSSKSGKLYLHTDIRLIFSRDKFEFDPSVATYELRSFVDPPPEPRYSPKS